MEYFASQDPRSASYSFYFDLNIWFPARKVIGTLEKRAPARKTQRSWVWNQFKPEFFEALSRNCFCWVHDWADFFSCYKNWQSRNRLIRSEIKRLNCLIILCLITEHASQRFTVLFKKKTISSLTSWKFMFSPTSMALLTKLWCVNVTPLGCPVVPCRINTQTMSCLVTWFWKLKNLVFSNDNQFSVPELVSETTSYSSANHR